jgi:hypothetical protein
VSDPAVGKKKLPVVKGGAKAAAAAAPQPPLLVAARIFAGLVFLAAIPVILAVPVGMRLFWTVTIATIPALIVVGGFHFWRKICPLALVGQLGRLVGKQGARKAGPWLATNYLYVQGGVLFFGLAVRLVATNGTPWALAAFLGAVVLVAATMSFLYTGKTWCNYVCPVGLVEKIYTEPVGREGSSQCAPCSACKKNCPDIDLEQGYWKEAAATPRRVVYFAWPGVVVAFYAYYYFCSGGWDYYFSGAWTREPEQWRLAFAPGFTFAPAIPRLVAAPLTLAFGGAVSFVVFAGVERLLRPRLAAERARHLTLVLAGFTAFLLFYLFAGQPTLAKAPWWVKRAVEAGVIGAAVLMLARRLGRSEQTYVSEKFARGLLKRWEWGDAPPSDDLAAIALIHGEREKQRSARLAAYKETIRELVADGVLARGELALLDSLRRQLGVSDAEHAKVLSELTAEEKQLFDPAYRGSVEQRLQREQYQRDLARVVVVAAREGVAPDAATLEGIRAQFGVARTEHEAALRALRAPDGPIARQLADEQAAIGQLDRALRRAQALGDADSRAVAFFAAVAAERKRQRGELATALASLVDGAPAAPSAPAADDAADHAALLAVAADPVPVARATAAYLLSRCDDEAARAAVRAAAADESPLVREAAIRALGARGRLTQDLVQRALDDADPRVKAAVLRAASRAGSSGDPAALAQTTHGVGSPDPAQFATLDRRAAVDTLSTLERMMFLREVPLFASLPPEDLEEVTAAASERVYPLGADLCRAGETGDEVFVIVSGRVRAHVNGTGGAPRVLGESSDGACIGELAAVDSGPRTATVTALADTRVVVLGGAAFRELCAERPAIAQHVLHVVTGRLRQMIAKVEA